MESNPVLFFGQTDQASALEVALMVTSSTSLPHQSAEWLDSKQLPCYCPFCWEVSLFKPFRRRADLKKHLNNFHRGNDIWVCPEPGCDMMFEWHSHFISHHKTHPQAPSIVRDDEAAAKVTLCPRLVFACGFSHCRYFGEARTHHDSMGKTTEFFHHILNHFRENIPLDWHYSVRLRNLMRCKRVNYLWKRRIKNGEELQWQPHSSFVLRKILETGHFSDSNLAELVYLAVISRSPPYCYPDSQTLGLYATLFTLPRMVDRAINSMSSSLSPVGAASGDIAMEHPEVSLAASLAADDGLDGSWMLLDNQEHFNPLFFAMQLPFMELAPTDSASSMSASQLAISDNGYYYHPPAFGSEFMIAGQTMGDYPQLFRQWCLSHPSSLGPEQQWHQQEGDVSDEDPQNYSNDSFPDPRLGPQTEE